MRSIVHINTNDVRGGAAKVARRLAEAQIRQGADVSMLVGIREGDSDWVYPFRLDRDRQSPYREQGLLDYDLTGSDRLTEHPAVGRADLIHAHNLHGGYFNPRSLVRLSHARPLLWTLHDMQAVTGHCAYSYDCDRWESGCGNCPNLQEYPAVPVDATDRLWRDKKEIYAQSVLYLVTPSLWLKRIVERSILAGHPVELIYNGVDTRVFRPGDRAELRRKLGLPDDRVLIGCFANYGALGNKRKGGGAIAEAIGFLKEKAVPFLVVNIGDDNTDWDDPFILSVGYVGDEMRMAEWYAAMDLFLFPSLADNCPLVVSEAMACGVPLVTFATGGIPELVRDGVHGAVAPQGDTQGLLQRLESLARNHELRRRMARQCREDAVRLYDHDRIAAQYRKAYEKCEAHYRDTCRKRNIRAFPAPAIGVPEPRVAILDMDERVLERLEHVDADLIGLRPPSVTLSRSMVSILAGAYRGEDIVYSHIHTLRNNGRMFYFPVTPLLWEKNGVFGFDLHLVHTMLFRREYLLRHWEEMRAAGVAVTPNAAGLHAAFHRMSVAEYIEGKLKKWNVRSFYIYGAGTHTDQLLSQLDLKRVPVKGIFDRDAGKAGATLRGLPVYHVGELPELRPEAVLISSFSYEDEIYRQLAETIPRQRVLRYYGMRD
ncbi:MAG: hypothetical protein BAA02_11910 [Paenibacillaceae bacterium ZCTH02-B3]|nr:MAG: hypothetical protein BAA02_11910 [Paenibacillaceae bacterium ZCTH02-B3]